MAISPQNGGKIVAGALVVSTWALDVGLSPEVAASGLSASGAISASASIPYSCDVTNVSAASFEGSGTAYAATGYFSYSQNDDTVWHLSGGSASIPSSASLDLSVAVSDMSTSFTLVNSSETTTGGALTPTSSVLDGNYASNSSQYVISMQEIGAPAMYAGTYVITGTISCEQNLGT